MTMENEESGNIEDYNKITANGFLEIKNQDLNFIIPVKIVQDYNDVFINRKKIDNVHSIQVQKILKLNKILTNKFNYFTISSTQDNFYIFSIKSDLVKSIFKNNIFSEQKILNSALLKDITIENFVNEHKITKQIIRYKKVDNKNNDLEINTEIIIQFEN